MQRHTNAVRILAHEIGHEFHCLVVRDQRRNSAFGHPALQLLVETVEPRAAMRIEERGGIGVLREERAVEAGAKTQDIARLDRDLVRIENTWAGGCRRGFNWILVDTGQSSGSDKQNAIPSRTSCAAARRRTGVMRLSRPS